jgi:hypothetical protein
MLVFLTPLVVITKMSVSFAEAASIAISSYWWFCNVIVLSDAK